MIDRADGFYAYGYDLYGNVTGELRVSQVEVTQNLNAPDVAAVTVLLDENWGPPVAPDYEPQPGGAAFSYLQPWAACVGVFDSESDTLLFYGPVVKRRRQAQQGGTGWASAAMELDCESWDGWLAFVYPELELQYGAAGGQTAASALAKVLWGNLVWSVAYQAWRVSGNEGAAVSTPEMRASVAGRAGVAFRFMPIERDSMGASRLVYTDWSTTGPDTLGQTSAASMIAEIVAQGVDFRVDAVMDPVTLKVSVIPVAANAPDWGASLPLNVLPLTAGGNVSAATTVDRGDLFASLVRVSSGEGLAGEFPPLAQTGNEALRAKLLVEKPHPMQQSGSPSQASLVERAKAVQAVLAPSPLEVTDVAVDDRLPTVKPGDPVVFITPKGSDPAAPGQEWEVLGRVQSIKWGSGVTGCEIALVEPGSDAAASIPRPRSLTDRMFGVESAVVSLMLR